MSEIGSFGNPSEEQWSQKRQIYLNTILKTLHDVSLLISRNPDPDRFFNSLPSILVRPDGFTMAWMVLLKQDQSAESGTFAGESGYPDIYDSFIREHRIPPCLEPFLNKTGCQVIDPFPAFHPEKPDQVLAGYAYPLRIKKQVAGVLVIAFDRQYANDEQHRQLFEEIAMDITTVLYHDRTLVRLQESEEKFRVLFERSADAQLIMKGDVFIECNDAMVRILGATSKSELIGLTPWEVSPLKQPDGSDSKAKSLQLVQDAESGRSMRFEWVHIRLDGKEVPVEISLTPVNYGSESFVHVAMRDISDRRKTEKELQVANQLFRLIMANTPDVIWIRDLEFKLTYINKAVERIKGFTQEEALGRILQDNVTRESLQVFKDALQEELDLEGKAGIDPSRVRRFESDELRKDGSSIHTETLASFIRDEKGKPTGMLGITRDISEQQQIFLELAHAKERAEESDRLKSAFLANMSHEIRTPMNSILGFAELLGEENLTGAERRQYIDIIQSGTNQLLSIISDIIDISKIQAGQVVLHAEAVNLSKLFQEMQVKYHMDLVKQNKSRVELVISERSRDLKGEVLIDLARVNQIMGNLISNAMKFTDAGTIEFGSDMDKDYIRFFVKDTGKGIAPAHQQIIFDRFRQVEETLSRTYTGTGLGLAICKGLVTLMGGVIGVSSEQGRGSEFWFTVPLARQNAFSTAAPHSPG